MHQLYTIKMWSLLSSIHCVLLRCYDLIKNIRLSLFTNFYFIFYHLLIRLNITGQYFLLLNKSSSLKLRIWLNKVFSFQKRLRHIMLMQDVSTALKIKLLRKTPAKFDQHNGFSINEYANSKRVILKMYLHKNFVDSREVIYSCLKNRVRSNKLYIRINHSAPPQVANCTTYPVKKKHNLCSIFKVSAGIENIPRWIYRWFSNSLLRVPRQFIFGILVLH